MTRTAKIHRFQETNNTPSPLAPRFCTFHISQTEAAIKTTSVEEFYNDIATSKELIHFISSYTNTLPHDDLKAIVNTKKQFSVDPHLSDGPSTITMHPSHSLPPQENNAPLYEQVVQVVLHAFE